MPTFVNPKRTSTYVLESELQLPPEQQHRWHLKALSAAEWETRRDISRDIDEETGRSRVLLGAWTMATVRYCLTGVEGPPGPVPFARDPITGYVTDEFLDSLHPDTRRALSLEIDRISKLDHSDVKS